MPSQFKGDLEKSSGRLSSKRTSEMGIQIKKSGEINDDTNFKNMMDMEADQLLSFNPTQFPKTPQITRSNRLENIQNRIS